MPKSKNRRKTKSQQTASTGAQGSLQAETIEGAGAGSTSAGKPAQPKKKVGPVQFLRQVRAEMQKVTWTGRGEVTVSTIMVLIMVAIMSLFFFLVDQLLRTFFPWLLSLNIF